MLLVSILLWHRNPFYNDTWWHDYNPGSFHILWLNVLAVISIPHVVDQLRRFREDCGLSKWVTVNHLLTSVTRVPSIKHLQPLLMISLFDRTLFNNPFFFRSFWLYVTSHFYSTAIQRNVMLFTPLHLSDRGSY